MAFYSRAAMHSRQPVWVSHVISRASWWRLLNPNDRTYLTGIGDSESGHEETLRPDLPCGADNPIGVIIAIGPAGLDLALELRRALWPTTPVVFAAVDADTITHELPRGVTGTFVHIKLANTVGVARAIVPDLRQIAFVGNRFEEQLYYRHFADEVPQFSDTLEFIDLMGLPLREIKRRVVALPPNSVVYYIGINSDPGATYNSAAQVLPSIVEVANRPIVVDAETLFGSGAVGGFIFSPIQIGQDAGRLALRILNGENASGIPVTTGSNSKPIFDWRQLQRWGINENGLPPGSEIRFRSPTAWEQYRLQILVIAAAITLQAALIWWLLYERRYRHRAEAVARDAASELVQMNRLAAAGELTASIAHEINQPLTGIVSNASAVRRLLSREKPAIDKVLGMVDQIEEAGHHASDVIKNIRAVFKTGTDDKSSVDVNRIIRAVLALGKKEMQKHEIKVEIELDNELPTVTGNEVQLQQVVLNLVMNATEAMAPVQPRILRIQSHLRKAGTVHVLIEDTGTGIDPANVSRIFKPLFSTKATGMGMGLSICHSIIESHGGRIWVTAGADTGSIFQFELPVG
jgi:signal transduction histidine kinase